MPTYISARPAAYSTLTVTTKKALREFVTSTEDFARRIDFQSTDAFHSDGSYFTLDLAYRVYGPVSVQVRDAKSNVIVIGYDGSKVTVS